MRTYYPCPDGNGISDFMVTIVDTLKPGAEKPRHPEKARRPDTPILRKPEWIRVKAPGSPVYAETKQIVREHGLVTVCEEAGCPNIGECWTKKHASSKSGNFQALWPARSYRPPMTCMPPGSVRTGRYIAS